MKINITIFLITVLLLSSQLFSQEKDYPLVSIPQTHSKNIPAGWILGGSNPHDYSVGIDLAESYSGFASAFIKSTAARPIGFVTLMQTFKANNYRNQRIRLTAYVKTKLVSEFAGVWMRINDIVGRPLAYDDMRTRPVVGTTDWNLVTIVLDVPPVGDEISIGVILRGKGQVWIDNLKFTTVGMDAPLTDLYNDKVDQYSPQNLNFEE